MGVYDLAKDALKLAQQIDNIELQRKILDMQNEALQMVEERQKLVDRVHELEEELQTHGELDFKDNCYWRGADGPFCTNCWDVGKSLVRMWQMPDPEYWQCPSCKHPMSVRGSARRQ